MSNLLTLSDAWAAYNQLHRVSRKSKQLGECLWSTYIFPFFHDIELVEIKAITILTFRRMLEATQLSPQSVHHCLSQVRRILRKAVLWELYPGPVPKFEMPHFDNRRMRFLSREEANTLLAFLKKRSALWHDISQFALHTGLRASEIFNLQSYNINFNAFHIYIMDSKNQETRVVPMNRVAFKIAQKHCSYHMPFVFTNNGKKITEVSKIFPQSVKDLGLNSGVDDRRHKVVFHTLRHTFAS